MHARTSIRQAFIARLCGATVAEARVYDSRIYSLAKQALPAIIVFSDHEDVVTDTISFPRSQSRTLRLTVQCYTKNNNAVTTEIDALTLQVEQLIMADSRIGGLVLDCKLESIAISFNNEGEKPVSVASLIFVVSYRARENNPTLVQ